jgi:hypothetical protein
MVMCLVSLGENNYFLDQETVVGGGADGGSSEMFDLMMEMFDPHEWDEEEEEPLSSPCYLEVLQSCCFLGEVAKPGIHRNWTKGLAENII